MKILLVGSSGGHLTQLLCLEPWWSKHERLWVTFDTPDATSKLAGERVLWCHHPTTRNIPNLARNGKLAWRTLASFRPDVLISTGAGAAVPFFWLNRWRSGALSVYLEVFDRVDSPTLTGRLCRPVTDMFLVQWPEQQRHYRSSMLLGPVW